MGNKATIAIFVIISAIAIGNIVKDSRDGKKAKVGVFSGILFVSVVCSLFATYNILFGGISDIQIYEAISSLDE